MRDRKLVWLLVTFSHEPMNCHRQCVPTQSSILFVSKLDCFNVIVVLEGFEWLAFLLICIQRNASDGAASSTPTGAVIYDEYD